MSLATLLRKLGTENGIEVPDEELAELGLSDDEADLVVSEDAFDLDAVLAGEAGGAVEIFLSNPVSMLADGQAIEADGLMWEPIIREGQWAVRPGANGQKVKRPLRVVAGHSKNQRKEIGLADILDAHEDRAVEHVTVPTSHDNHVTQNTGFIQALKIVKGKVRDAKTKADKTVAILMGGYDIRKKDIKESLLDGSIASRSAGLLYDYVNTETGKKYPVVLEHVALTNKPWITGMKAFGRKLVKPLKPAPVGLSLSDEEPTEQDMLAVDDVLDGLELADATLGSWTQDEDPDWLREQTDMVLRAARAKKAAAKGAGDGGYLVYDGLPNYRCVRAKPGLALIADGWGDNANFWSAPIKVVDGYVEISEDLTDWEALKKEFVRDEDRKDFPDGREPLSESEPDPLEGLTGLALAQAKRRLNKKTQGTTKTVEPDRPTTHPRGGEHMAGENGTLQLSDEAQRRIDEAERRAAAAEKRAEEADKRISVLFSRSVESEADKFVGHLKSIGLDEEHGFAGALAEIRDLMLADDGGEAVQSDKFSDDGNAEGTLTLSQALQRVFKAIELSEDGKVKLGQAITPPATTVTTTTETADGETKTEVKLGADGKPLPEGGEKVFEELSDEEKDAQLARDNPVLAKALGLAMPSANGSSKGGE
jgi:hypothetical protein